MERDCFFLMPVFEMDTFFIMLVILLSKRGSLDSENSENAVDMMQYDVAVQYSGAIVDNECGTDSKIRVCSFMDKDI